MLRENRGDTRAAGEPALPLKQRIHGMAVLVFITAAVLLTFGCRYPSGNHYVEAPPILARVNPALYTADFFVRDAREHFTPRTYSDTLVAGIVRTGASISTALFLVYAAALLLLVAALHALAQHWKLSAPVATLLITWPLLAVGTELGMTRLIFNAPVPSVYATAVAVWGVFFALRSQWPWSFLCFGIACLLQFLVGLLPALLCLPFLIVDVMRRREYRGGIIALLMLGIGAAAVYLPMRTQGATSSDLLSNEAFVFLYGYVRAPHHIVPSAWLRQDWIDAALFFGGGLALCARCKSSLKWMPFGVVAATVFFLLINYVFVEIWPLAIVAKLQFARMIPFAVLSVLLVLALVVQEEWQAGRYALCGFIAAMPLAPYGMALLALLALALPQVRQASGRLSTSGSALLGAAIFVVVLIGVPDLERTIPIDPRWALPMIALVLLGEVLHSHPRPVATALLPGLGILVVAAAASGRLPESLPQAIRMADVPQDQMLRLAAKYKTATPRDALILIPPSLHQFRLLSSRSVVVDAKAQPFTDAGMLEWKIRMDAVLGARIGADMWMTLDERYFTRTPTALVEVARGFGATHVLTHTGLQPEIPGKVLVSEGQWVIWNVPQARPGEEPR